MTLRTCSSDTIALSKLYFFVVEPQVAKDATSPTNANMFMNCFIRGYPMLDIFST